MDDAFLSGTMIILFLISLVWRFWRSRQLVHHWAERNGYELLEREHRILRTGPYFLRGTSVQPVYRVTVRDRSGRKREGWLLLGHGLWGLFLGKVNVTWSHKR